MTNVPAVPRWQQDPIAKPQVFEHRRVFDGERERCWNCGYTNFIEKRPPSATVILVIGILFFLVGALFALAVQRRSYCTRCGQKHQLLGTMTLADRQRQAGGADHYDTTR